MIASILAGLHVATAQNNVDRYQKAGNDVGETFNSIGAVLNSGNADAQYLSGAADSADRAIASLRGEINAVDWSYLGLQAAEQHNANMQYYLNNLDYENSRLHALATQAAIAERNQPAPQQQQQQPGQQRVAWSAPTGMPKMQNKAVVHEESHSTTTAPTSSATDKAESKSESKESKSESKMSKDAAKSEAHESKAASKSSSKEAKSESSVNAAATGKHNSTNSTASKTPSSSHHHKNTAAVASVSGGAIFLAVLALM